MKPERIKELREKFAFKPVGSGGATVRELNAREVYECLDEIERLTQAQPTDFESSLTEAEKNAETFLEWSDATVARCVRHMAEQMQDGKGFDALASTAAVNILAAVMDRTNAETLKLEAKGDRPGCTWELRVVAKLVKVLLTDKMEGRV